MLLEELQEPSTEVSVTELVLSAQAGDRQAMGELVVRFEQAVYHTVFRRLRNEAEAQELCQEVFIQALRKLDQLNEPKCFGGWLRAIADRMAINRATRRAPEVSAESSTLEATCVEHRTPLGAILAREAEIQLHRGLERLTAMDRDTLVAFYFHGESLLEMSDRFHSPVGTIKRRLHVARKRLAKELESLAPA